MINEIKFEKILSEVITKEDKIIVLYSGIWSFIKKINFNINNPKKIPEVILDIIEKKIGKDKTLFLPSFTGESFYKKKYFSIDTDIDKINGFIPIAALKRSYFRTKQPIHSYLVFGKKVKEVRKLKLLTSWGPTSILGWLSKNNARICVMGIPWNKGCSYLHRFEELYKVPWRYFKIYNGLLIRNNQKKYCFEKKYSSPENGVLKYDFNPFVKFLKTKNIFIKGKCDFFLESTTTNQIDNFSKIFYKKNKFWEIVKNKNEIKNWIKNNPN